MNENVKWIAAAVAVVGLSIGAVVYRDKWWTDRQPAPEEPVAPAPVAAPPVEAVPAEPAVKHPLPTAETDQALPALDGSDASMLGELGGVVGKESLERFVVPKDLVRHIVVSIDNLSTEKVAERIRPVKPTPGTFAVAGTEEAPVLDPANYSRYQPLVRMVGSTDTQQLVAIYTRYYPLFQDAYANLGHPPEYFNDSLVEVIDHLLATPELPGPIALTRPGVRYEFADPELEAKSAGQKLLIRMGPENARAVKEKLAELRTQLIARQPMP